MYSGLEHSSCSQYINEKHYSLDQVKIRGHHSSYLYLFRPAALLRRFLFVLMDSCQLETSMVSLGLQVRKRGGGYNRARCSSAEQIRGHNQEADRNVKIKRPVAQSIFSKFR